MSKYSGGERERGVDVVHGFAVYILPAAGDTH